MVNKNQSVQFKIFYIALLLFNLSKIVQINYIFISKLIYILFLFNFKINKINILNTIFYYNFSCN